MSLKGFFNRLLGLDKEGSNEGSFYVSWYETPVSNVRFYLRKDTEDCGYVYVDNMDIAHCFSTYEEALAATPVYDGSAGIGRRTGVKRVYCRDSGRLAEW